MVHDAEYFHRRAEEARNAASRKDGDGVEVAGDLALAYRALARKTARPAPPAAEPMLLRE